MKLMMIITILVTAMFLAGCAVEEISMMSDEEYEKQASEEPVQKQTISTKTYTVDTPKEPSEEPEEPEERISVKETGGDTVTLKKLPDYTRDKDISETCVMDYPLECADYLAKDGIIYLTIKNVGYESKLNEVILTLNGDSCDPIDTYIETGHVKEFECYVDPDIDTVSGNLEIEYYSPIQQKHFTKGGKLTVLME